LLATKAARVCQAAQGEPVLEFGLRRSQGIDGGLSVARASYIGGCSATSNVLAGKVCGIPVKGTHAHSWVMSFDTEEEAFDRWAEAMPHNSIFLVDTYDTLEGVRSACRVGQRLRERGEKMAGVRLDSGDLAYLSIESRRILDEAGFNDTKIVASGDLDEYIIQSLKQQGATIGVWGVGTKMSTAYDEPALKAAYKLCAVRDEAGRWQDRIKLSELTAKTSDPGILQVRRFQDDERFIADAIYHVNMPPKASCTIVDPGDATRRRRIEENLAHEDLLVPVFRAGRCIYERPPLRALRQRTRDQLAKLHRSIKRFENPHEYPAGLERRLHELKTQLIMEARGHGEHEGPQG
jgi:nicotinate phosphoribosyltransferase